MSYQFTAGRFKGWASDNTPLAGGRLYTYSSGTTTHKAAYTDATLGAACTYVSDGVGGLYIALDSKGEAQLWLGSGAYTFKLTDSSGSTVWTVDGVRDVEDELRADLASASDAAKGSGMMGHGAAVPYPTGSIGKAVQDLAALVALKDQAYIQVTGADSTGVADSYAAIRSALRSASSVASAINTVFLGAGSYKLSAGLVTHDDTAPAGSTQCGFVGAGPFATKLNPTGDFTAVTIVTSYVECGGFSVHFASGLRTSARIGIEFASANSQLSQTKVKNILVENAYRSFILRDWTGQPYGSLYLVTLENLLSINASDWGFHLNSKNGSTTLTLNQCYAKGGGSGKGFYINQFGDVLINTMAIDGCLDQWLEAVNVNVLNLQNLALEANTLADATKVAVNINANRATVIGVKDVSSTYSTTGNARIIGMGANCRSLALSSFEQQGATVGGAAIVYKASLNSAASRLSIIDDSIQMGEVLDNGYFANIAYNGQIISRTGTMPNYGTWVKGTVVVHGAPTAGQPKGWARATNGSAHVLGTDWLSLGNF